MQRNTYRSTFYGVNKYCLQIIGFDILITKNLLPVLLEVNSSPSLTIEHDIFYPFNDNKENIEPLRVRSIVDEVSITSLIRKLFFFCNFNFYKLQVTMKL